MRLIDADILMEKIRCNRNGNCKECDFFTYGDTWCDGKIFGTTIMQATTVDAVPVIRCEDCVHRRKDDDFCKVMNGFCGDGNFFCASGIREDNA